MKKILFILLILLFSVSGVQASEIFGTISTDPDLLNHLSSTTPDDNSLTVNDDNKINVPADGGSGFIFQKPVQDNKISETAGQDSVKVLGLKYYPDNSLLRDDSNKIYFIKGKVKKLIHNLKELEKYRGQVIYEGTDEELSLYQAKEHLDGDLIRIKGAFKIYVIRNGQKQYIKNLEELRRHYFGLEIFNISQEEMKLY